MFASQLNNMPESCRILNADRMLSYQMLTFTIPDNSKYSHKSGHLHYKYVTTCTSNMFLETNVDASLVISFNSLP